MSRARSPRITRSGSWTSSCTASPPADPSAPGRLAGTRACYGTWRMGRDKPPPPAPGPYGARRREDSGVSPMATYRMVYGDDEQVVRETYEDITEVEREDGWVVLFRGPEAIVRVQEAHVQELELLEP